MAAIQHCRTWQELRFLHQLRRSEFNHLHLTATVSKAAHEQPQGPLRPNPDFSSWLLAVMDSICPQSQQLGGRELSTVLWAAIKLHWQPHPAWLLTITACIQRRSHTLRARDVATIVWALSHFPPLPPATTSPLFPALLAAAASRMPAFNSHDLSLLLHGLARLPAAHPLPAGWLERCLKEVGIKLTSCTPQALSNILHSLRLMRHNPPPIWMDSFLFEASCKAPSFTPQVLAGILGSLAASNHRCPPALLDHLLDSSAHRLPHANPLDLSSMLWALARLQHTPAPHWTASALASLTHCAPALLPAQLSLALWGIAKLRLAPPDALLHQLAAASRKLLRGCNAQDLAQLVWAWGALGISPGPEWLHRVADVMQAHLHSCPPRALAHLLVGFAQLDHVPEPRWLLRALAHCCSRLHGCSTRDLLDLSWALARLQVKPYRAWMEQCLAALLPRLQTLQAAHLVQVAWALHRLDAAPGEEFMERLVEACLPLLPAMSAKQASMLAISTTSLGVPARLAPAFCDALVQASYPELRAYNHQCLAGVLRSVALLPCTPPASWVGKAADVVYHRMGGMNAGPLLAVVAALGQLGHRPRSSWLLRLYDTTHAVLPELPAPHLQRLLTALAGLVAAARSGRGAAPGAEWQQRCVRRLLELMPDMPAQTLAHAAEACALLGWELPPDAVQQVQASTSGEWRHLDAGSSLALVGFAVASGMRPQRVWAERCLHQYRSTFDAMSARQRLAYLRLVLRLPCAARAGYVQRFSATINMLSRRLPAAEAAQLRALLRRLQLQHSCQPG